jgi:hypothetical protein
VFPHHPHARQKVSGAQPQHGDGGWLAWHKVSGAQPEHGDGGWLAWQKVSGAQPEHVGEGKLFAFTSPKKALGAEPEYAREEKGLLPSALIPLPLRLALSPALSQSTGRGGRGSFHLDVPHLLTLGGAFGAGDF